MSGPARETAAEKAETRAIRRRWITLGEAVAVAGVIIAALTWWSNWSERRTEHAQEQVEHAARTRAASRVTLTATPQKGGESLALADAAHAITAIDVRFPPALGVAQQSSVLEPAIEGDWLAKPLLAATDGGPDDLEGRVPLAITAHWTDGERDHTGTAIYDVVFRTEGRALLGRKLSLRGILLRERVNGDASARLDALWAVEAKRLAALKG